MEDETVKEITNETETVRRRSIGLAILFSIITFGVYYLYWFVKVTTDSNRIGDIKTANGFLSLIFIWITFGIYGYYWAFKLGKKPTPRRADAAAECICCSISSGSAS